MCRVPVSTLYRTVPLVLAELGEESRYPFGVLHTVSTVSRSAWSGLHPCPSASSHHHRIIIRIIIAASLQHRLLQHPCAACGAIESPTSPSIFVDQEIFAVPYDLVNKNIHQVLRTVSVQHFPLGMLWWPINRRTSPSPVSV